MHKIENAIGKSLYIVSETLLDIGLLIGFSFNVLFGLIGDPDCKAEAERMFKKIKEDFLK